MCYGGVTEAVGPNAVGVQNQQEMEEGHMVYSPIQQPQAWGQRGLN